MEPAYFSHDGIVLNGTVHPLWSGSFQYWRSDRKEWERILDSIVSLGFHMVETYVPWGVHELEKGRYDFGDSDPNKDLRAFCRLCREREIYILLRPGPHINAEMDYFGYPERIVMNPAYMARTYDQDPLVYPYSPRPFPVLSYASDEFFQEVWEYFDAVYAQIADQIYPDGPIIALQADNEYCCFFRDAPYLADYSEASLRKYRKFLLGKYGSLESVSQCYRETLLRPEDLMPPTGFSADGYRKCMDWLLYKESDAWDVLKKISDYWRGKGLRIPLYHNTALRNYPPTDFVGMQRGAVDLAGIDMYLYPREHECIRQTYHYLSGSSRLSYVPEFICGSWSDNARALTETEQEFLTLYALMHGVQAANFYMLVERDRWLASPIAADGRIRSNLFKLFQRITQFYLTYRLYEPKERPEILLLKNYELQRMQAIYSQTDYNFLPTNSFVSGFNIPRSLFTPRDGFGFAFERERRRHWGEEPWLDALCSALSASDTDYDVSDTQLAPDALGRYRRVCVSAFECMSSPLQKKLRNYVGTGGELYLSCMPRLDMEMQPCTILADSVDGRPEPRVHLLRPPFDDLPVPDRRLRHAPGLEMTFRRTSAAHLLFIANLTEKNVTDEIPVPAWLRVGKSVWRMAECLFSLEQGKLQLRMAPYSIGVWEVSYDCQ